MHHVRFTLRYSHMLTHWEVPCAVHPYDTFMCDFPNDDMIPLNFFSNAMDHILGSLLTLA
jgi:hypothetical protein